MPEQVSIFFPSQAGSKLKLGILFEQVCPGGCSKHFPCLFFAGGFIHIGHNCFPARAAQVPSWTFLQAEDSLSMTKSTSSSLLPSGSLYVDPPLMWEWWPKVSSLRQGSLPRVTREMEDMTGFEDWVWSTEMKNRVKSKGKCNPPLCSREVNSCVFPENLMPGEMTEPLLLAHSSSPISSWVLKAST